MDGFVKSGGDEAAREGYTNSEDNSPNIIIEPRRPHSLLMRFRRPSLLRQHKPRPNPHSSRSKHQSSSHRLAIEQPTGRDNLDVLASEGALLALAHLGHGGDQDGGGDVAGVAAALAALGADHVRADVEAFLYVFRVPDHVHVEDASFVEALNDVSGGDADGTDEELGARVDDDGHEFVELAFGVVVAGERGYGC